MRTLVGLRSYERLVERVHNWEYDTNSPDVHCRFSPEAVVSAFERSGTTDGTEHPGITCKTAAIFDNSKAFALEAQMSMVLTCFLIIAMGFGAFMIASDLSVLAEPLLHLMDIFTKVNEELYRDYDPEWTWGGPSQKETETIQCVAGSNRGSNRSGAGAEHQGAGGSHAHVSQVRNRRRTGQEHYH